MEFITSEKGGSGIGVKQVIINKHSLKYAWRFPQPFALNYLYLSKAWVWYPYFVMMLYSVFLMITEFSRASIGMRFL